MVFYNTEEQAKEARVPVVIEGIRIRPKFFFLLYLGDAKQSLLRHLLEGWNNISSGSIYGPPIFLTLKRFNSENIGRSFLEFVGHGLS